MDTEIVVVAGDDRSQQNAARGVQASPTPPRLVVEPPTVAATRAVLASLAGIVAPVPVVGWADLTAPNLVDLLDDLVAGPGGHHLVALGLAPVADEERWIDDVAVRRGLACLQQARLSLRLFGASGPTVLSRLAKAEPALTVITDDCTGRASDPPAGRQ